MGRPPIEGPGLETIGEYHATDGRGVGGIGGARDPLAVAGDSGHEGPVRRAGTAVVRDLGAGPLLESIRSDQARCAGWEQKQTVRTPL